MDRVDEFISDYLGQDYYEIRQGYTTFDNVMKQGRLFRIYFNNTRNGSAVLKQYLGTGNGSYERRIYKGVFNE